MGRRDSRPLSSNGDNAPGVGTYLDHLKWKGIYRVSNRIRQISVRITHVEFFSIG
jgi:hypothetical protein